MLIYRLNCQRLINICQLEDGEPPLARADKMLGIIPKVIEWNTTQWLWPNSAALGISYATWIQKMNKHLLLEKKWIIGKQVDLYIGGS